MGAAPAPFSIKGEVSALRFFSIASGSKGNCICVESGGTAVLIDAGVPSRRVAEVLHGFGIAPAAVKGVFITHEHSDHVKCLPYVIRAVKAPVFANMNTINALNLRAASDGCAFYELPTGREADMGALSLCSFRTSHDAAESVGYVVSDGKTRLAVCTDTGRMTKEASEAIAGCRLVYIESNHDEEMLINGPYPAYLKDRILSSRGHLSNTECACSCRAFAASGAEHFVLAHLSEENNTPELAVTTVGGILAAGGVRVGDDCTLEAAGQYGPSRVYEI